jgi:flagellar assembly protein FliH
MATIIKAGHAPVDSATVRPIAFNYDDVVINATSQLEKVRQQAGQILAEARREADVLKKQAQQQGRAAAEAEARKKIALEIKNQLEQQMTTLRPALENAIAQIATAKVACTRQWEQNMVRLATGIAACVIRQQVATQPKITLSLVREALELAVGSQRIRVRMSPADRDALEDQVQQLVAQLEQVGTTEIVADPAIEAGSCVVDTEFGQIDQQWQTQLRRIEEELS